MDDEQVPENLWYEGPNLRNRSRKEKRVFCFERYELSHRLPEIIRNLGEDNCYRTRGENFFTIKLTSRDGRKVEYEVYFDVTRSKQKGRLYLVVQSAYARTDDYATTQPEKRKIGLGTIAYKKLFGRRIR